MIVAEWPAMNNQMTRFVSVITILLPALCEPLLGARVPAQSVTTAASPSDVEEQQRILSLLKTQQGDWNRGDIDSFMEGYERSEHLIFTSGGTVRRGWEAAMRRYRETYPDRDTMGRLTFSDLEVTLLGPNAAVVLGKYQLRRAKDSPHGVFTLILQKKDGSWKIIHDHTSTAP